jgi:glycosyltransferase involved in cell wall biosynthesis
MLLDIIVPHYKEPWSVGKKFFDMLDLQRGADFGQFRVIVVNDGEEYHLPDECFDGRPYEVTQIDIPHGGVSAARNAGLEAATAEWVNFCDYDDMYTNVYALKSVMDVLPKAVQFDLLWTPFIAEDRTTNHEMWLHLRDDMNVVFCHGKYWRRSFLMETGLRFDTEINFSEDSEFCAVAETMLENERVGRIDPIMPAYMWVYRENSVTTTPGRYVECKENLFHRHKKLCEAFRQRYPYERYCAQIARTIIDGYHVLNLPVLPPSLIPLRHKVREFYLEHKEDFWKCDKNTMREIKAVSREENVLTNPTPDVMRDLANPKTLIDESVSVTEWLRRLESEENDDEI